MFRLLLVVVALCALVLIAGPSLLGWDWDPLGYGLWWLTNSSPPQARIDGPDGAVRGTAQLAVVSPDQDRADVVEAQVDDRPVQAGWTLPVDTTALQDGEHTVRALLRDRSRRRNTAVVEYVLRTDNTPPALQLELAPAAPTEGHVLVLRIRTEDGATVSGDVDGRALDVQPGGEFRWAVIGIPI